MSHVGFKIWKILNLQDEPLGESEEQYRRATVVSPKTKDKPLFDFKIKMVTLPGFEPGIPPWKGDVLTAWP